MSKIIIGIDGGLNGAITVIKDNKILDKIIMPIVPAGNGRNEYDCHAIIEFLEQYKTAEVVLEKAQYTPALGGISSFAFGKSYGTMIGILSALKFRYHLIAARTWQTRLFRDMPHQNTKQLSAIVAKRLFPDDDFRSSERSKKIHDGLSDSALIAYYGQNYL